MRVCNLQIFVAIFGGTSGLKCFACEKGDVACEDQYTRPLAHQEVCPFDQNACVKYTYYVIGANQGTLMAS